MRRLGLRWSHWYDPRIAIVRIEIVDLIVQQTLVIQSQIVHMLCAGSVVDISPHLEKCFRGVVTIG